MSSRRTALSRREPRADGLGMLCSSAEGRKLGSGGRSLQSENDSSFFKGGHFLTKVPPLAWFALKGAEAKQIILVEPSGPPQAR